MKKHGDPLVVGRAPARRGAEHPSWVGEAAKYNTVHVRMNKRFGPASAHQCSCGAKAKDWAYDHRDPAEVHGSDGPFSHSIDHYVPLCRLCHNRLDSRPRKRCVVVAP